jgi:hypothetical protein
MQMTPPVFVLCRRDKTEFCWNVRLWVRDSDAKLMARAIAKERPAASVYGREFVKRMAVERFQVLTQKLRMGDAEAGELFEQIWPEVEAQA